VAKTHFWKSPEGFPHTFCSAAHRANLLKDCEQICWLARYPKPYSN